MNFGAEQVIGLLGLLVLIPFIIVYLIKPKPVKLPVPSLLFFMKKAKATTKESFMRIFQKDYLFYIQLFVLLLLALSLAYPYISIKRDVVSKNLVFVLDASASSQVVEADGRTRFDVAKNKIYELASDSNTIILAKSYPIVALKNAGKSELGAFLNRIKPTEDESRIGDAILMAGDVLGEEKGRVIVLSDFINTRGVSVKTAVDILKSKDIAVDSIDTDSTNRKNLGVVNIIADEGTSAVYVQNFNNQDIEANLDVDGKAEKLLIPANNVEPFIYKTKEGISQFKILNKDDFMVDNNVYISNPVGNKINVAYVTNYPSKFLLAALNSSSRVKLVFAEPPVVPKKDIDIYIIGKIDGSKILPGTYENILKNVENGASVVLTAFDGVENVDFNGLSEGVKFSSAGLRDNNVSLVQINVVTPFTKDIYFGDVKKVYSLDAYTGDVIAESSGVPVITYSEKGSGKFVYYGLPEKYSSFQLSPDFPVFWVGLLKYLTGAKEMSEVNLNTGMSFVDDKGNELVLDEAGYFNVSGNQVVVNLLNSKESDVNNKGEEFGSKISNFKFETLKEDVRNNFLDYLVIIGLLLVLFEIYYINKRGLL